MKLGSLFLLLAVLAYVGWQSLATHQQGKEKNAHELMEGYDRCVGALDESMANSRLSPGWNSGSPEAKELERNWMEARKGCREFYFGGVQAGDSSPSSTVKESSLVMYAPDGVLEEVPDSRAQFAAQAGFVPVMWFKPPGYTRAFPVPLNGTQMAMYNKGWTPLQHPLTAAEARGQYWTVRPPRAN